MQLKQHLIRLIYNKVYIKMKGKQKSSCIIIFFMTKSIILRIIFIDLGDILLIYTIKF